MSVCKAVFTSPAEAAAADDDDVASLLTMEMIT